MLIKSISFKNFRQFITPQKIEFSIDPEKNVTVVMGNNGTGKTTLSQAFVWCLYGTTTFNTKPVLNKNVEKDMSIDKSESSFVEIEFVHSNIEYTVSREEFYQKEMSGKIKTYDVVVKMSFKTNGQIEFVKSNEIDYKIKEILPQELSNYFFFDGEKIGNLSKEIAKGKSEQFAKAVRNLLGLSAFEAAIKHFNKGSKNSVIGSYRSHFDGDADIQISELSNKIQDIDTEIVDIKTRIDEIDEQNQIASNNISDLEADLKRYEKTAELQKNKEKYKTEVEKYERLKSEQLKNIIRSSNANIHAFVAASLIPESINTLLETNNMDKGIPDIHARTIDFLLKQRRKCICGEPLEFGNPHFVELVKLLDYIPPKSLGTLIHDFTNEAESYIDQTSSFISDLTGLHNSYSEFDSLIFENQENVDKIEEELKGLSEFGHIQRDIISLYNTKNQLDREKSDKQIKLGSLKEKLDGLRKEFDHKITQTEKNKKLYVYLTYAESLLDELQSHYKEKEDATRIELENRMNNIFKLIYDGGFQLSIDEKYAIRIQIENNEIETSTGQSLSVIFAFISGVIEMAKERVNDEELKTEPFPLVMDAPLSAFDKTRIETISNTIPRIAEQVIIFIKDTDGELAEQYIGNKMGKKYVLKKVANSEFITEVYER